MPIVKLPDGTTFGVPEGTTKQQVLEFAQSKMGPPKSVSERARANQDPNSPGNQLSDRVIAEAGQDERNLYGRAAGAVAAAVPLALAAPVTAGAGLTGYGIAAAAGLAGSLADKAAKFGIGSNEIPDTKEALMASLGVDTAMNVLFHGTGRAITGTTVGLLPKLVQSAAATSEEGNTLLKSAFVGMREKLYSLIYNVGKIDGPPISPSTMAVANRMARAPGSEPIRLLSGQIAEPASGSASELSADIGPSLQKAMDRIRALPKGNDAIGRGLTSHTPRGKELVDMVNKTLEVNRGSISANQPVAALIEMRTSLNGAIKSGQLSTKEEVIFEELSKAWDREIRKELGTEIGPEAINLYEKSNKLAFVALQRDKATSVAKDVISDMFSRYGIGAATGGAAGGAYGYRKGGVTGGILGALTGSVMGASAQHLIPGVATFALRRALEHPEAATSVSKAIEFASTGKGGAARLQMERAFAVAGVRDMIKDYANSDEPIPQPPAP